MESCVSIRYNIYLLDPNIHISYRHKRDYIAATTGRSITTQTKWIDEQTKTVPIFVINVNICIKLG